MISIKLTDDQPDQGPAVYTVDADDKNQVLEFRTAMKKPIPVQVCQMPSDFEVETAGGMAQGNKDDWLMQAPDGEYYPCPDALFQITYDILD